MRENDGFVRRETGGRKSQEKKAILLMVSLVSDASPDHVSSLMDPGYKPEIDSKKILPPSPLRDGGRIQPKGRTLQYRK